MPIITEIKLRVAVFVFVFPISRSAHLWAPDEVTKNVVLVKNPADPLIFIPPNKKKQ